MNISIKNKDTSFSLPIPFWLIELIPSGIFNIILRHSHSGKEDLFISNINFNDIKKSLYVLKDYKGLKIFEVKSKNGDEVIIKV